MPVPSIAVPTKVKDGWSFAGADELDVRSLAGREEELESLSSEYTHLGQQRQEMRLLKIGGQTTGYSVTDHWHRKRLREVGARVCGGEGTLKTSKGRWEAHHLLYVDEDRGLCIFSAGLALSLRFWSSSPRTPAVTNGMANATTSRGLRRCMIATMDTRVGK